MNVCPLEQSLEICLDNVFEDLAAFVRGQGARMGRHDPGQLEARKALVAAELAKDLSCDQTSVACWIPGNRFI